MAEKFTPVVLSSDGSNHDAIGTGNVLDSAYIDKQALISTDTGNLVKAGTDGGLLVSRSDLPSANPSSLVSAVTGNALSVAADDKLYVASSDAPAASTFVSSDAGNQIVLGSDRKLYVAKPSTKTASEFISTDLGNSLTTGTDSKLFSRAVSTDANNLVKRGSDNGAHLTASDIISNGTSENLITVNSTDHGIQLAKSAITNIVDDKINDLDIEKISLSASEQILALSASVLSATVSLAYNSGTGYLTLYGKSNNVLSTVYIPGATSMLSGVEVVTNPTGYAAGTYFKYTFNTSSGATTTFVKVPEGSTVAAGNGIRVSTSGGVSTVSAVAGDGITVGSGGISVDVVAATGLSVSSAGLATVLKPNGGIVATSSGLAMDTTIVPTEAALTALAARVTTAEGDIDQIQTDVADLQDSAISLTTVSRTVDPSALSNGEGALYPAEDLLP